MSPARPPWALYDATVVHARRSPIVNRFRYRTFYWLIDVENPPRLSWPLRAVARFDPADHVDIRRHVTDLGVNPARILMLAHPRTLGYAFNPISVYWCYDATGEQLAAAAEVHNTYGGRHVYLLRPDGNGGRRRPRRCTSPRFTRSTAATTSVSPRRVIPST